MNIINADSRLIPKFVYEPGEAGGSLVEKIPINVLVEVLVPLLSFPDCRALSQLSKTLKDRIQPILPDLMLREIIFGKNKWEKMIPGVVSVGNEPSLTLEQCKAIKAKLQMKCPIFNEKDESVPHRFQKDIENGKTIRVWQSLRLVLFPETIQTNEDIKPQPRTVNKSGRVFRFLKDETSWMGNTYKSECLYSKIEGQENEAFRIESAPASCWKWVTVDVLPGSRNMSYDEKVRLAESKSCHVPTTNEACTFVPILNLGVGPAKDEKEYFYGQTADGCNSTLTATTGVLWSFHVNVGLADRWGISATVHYNDGSKYLGVAGVAEIP